MSNVENEIRKLGPNFEVRKSALRKAIATRLGDDARYNMICETVGSADKFVALEKLLVTEPAPTASDKWANRWRRA
jgi:hypothetical protein